MLDIIVNFFTGGSPEANAKNGETRAPANTTNANGETKGQSGASADQHTVVTSENLNGQNKDSSGRAIMTEGYMMRDAFTGEVIGGSI